MKDGICWKLLIWGVDLVPRPDEVRMHIQGPIVLYCLRMEVDMVNKACMS